MEGILATGDGEAGTEGKVGGQRWWKFRAESGAKRTETLEASGQRGTRHFWTHGFASCDWYPLPPLLEAAEKNKATFQRFCGVGFLLLLDVTDHRAA